VHKNVVDLGPFPLIVAEKLQISLYLSKLLASALAPSCQRRHIDVASHQCLKQG